MSADVAGVLLVAIPIICAAIYCGFVLGWDVLGVVVGALLVAGSLSAVMTFGIYLIAEGWPA